MNQLSHFTQDSCHICFSFRRYCNTSWKNAPIFALVMTAMTFVLLIFILVWYYLIFIPGFIFFKFCSHTLTCLATWMSWHFDRSLYFCYFFPIFSFRNQFLLLQHCEILVMYWCVVDSLWPQISPPQLLTDSSPFNWRGKRVGRAKAKKTSWVKTKTV